MTDGQIIQGVRWLRDAAGRLVGYRNPVTDKDEDCNLAAIQTLVSAAGISGATYDGSGRLTGYTRQGVAHTVSYPSSTTVVVSNTTGAEREVTLDGSGRVQAIA